MDIPLLEEYAQIIAARSHWRYRGQERPEFAIEPGPGQESVWDYPRPPAIETVRGLMQVFHEGQLLAETREGKRVLETAGAPTYYFPPDSVQVELTPSGGRSVCEWKGLAQSLTVAGVPDAAWRYVQMFPAFKSLYLWVAFYPNRVECRVDGEIVKPQPGGYYGGWVTGNLVGPIKGEPGSGGW